MCIRDSSQVVILNNRSDRTDRAQMFIQLINEELHDRIDRCVLFGQLQEVVQQQLTEGGFPSDKIVTTAELSNPTGENLLEKVVGGIEGRVAAYGMVNIHTDHATDLRNHLAELEEENLAGVGAASESGTSEAATAQAVPAQAAPAKARAGVA